MRGRSLCLIVAALALTLGSTVHAARVLDHYDTDSLVALSSLIVKAEIISSKGVQTRDGDCAVWDVKILSGLAGTAEAGNVIRVAGIEEYRKGPGIDGVGPRRYERLAPGDVVYLFLLPKDARAGYASYALTDADYKVVESGLRLVGKDRVHAFGQYTPPGPMIGSVPGFVAMTDQTFPKAERLTVEAFEARVSQAVAFVADLQTKLRAGPLPDADRRKILASRAAVLKRELARDDHIRWLIEAAGPAPTTRPG